MNPLDVVQSFEFLHRIAAAAEIEVAALKPQKAT